VDEISELLQVHGSPASVRDIENAFHAETA